VTVRASRFKINAEGMDAVLRAIAEGMNELALEVADGVREAAPRGERGTERPLPTNRGGAYVFHGDPSRGSARYRKTIHATTFIRGKVFKGSPVRGVGRTTYDVRSVVYSTSFTAHMLEFGVAPHEIPVAHGPEKLRWQLSLMGLTTAASAGPTVKALHPGSRRFPHFWPGFASRLPAGIARMTAKGVSVSRVGGKLNTRMLG